MGYLSAVIQKAGFKTLVVDIRKGNDAIIGIVKEEDPFIIGFSVIFQYHIYQFRDLVRHLRKENIFCHFTAGGSYASLRPEALFKTIPGLDSIVRFEGEYTFLNLVRSIHSRSDDWRNLKGIAYKEKGEVILNLLRPFEINLDKFPFPVRSSPREYAFDKKFATIIAGRGCIHNCSYCNTRKFYSQSGGPVRRLRKPEMVIKEMEYLYIKHNCPVFLFQDDDFPVTVRNGSGWISGFCKELIRKKLNDKLMWKINCRPDEIDEERFRMMKQCGLFMLFMGIEDGTGAGLNRLNRNMSLARSKEGIKILKKLKIGFDYGFMLFQPSSTFRSIYENLEFLKQVCGDGYTPVTFLKLMPYFETRVEEELSEEGRLKGRPGFFDYDFLEDSMNHYFGFVAKSFMKWQWDPEGLANISKWARNYFLVYDKFYDSKTKVSGLHTRVRKIISESNLFLIDTMKELAKIFESGQYSDNEQDTIKEYSSLIRKKHKYYLSEIKDSLEKLIILVE